MGIAFIFLFYLSLSGPVVVVSMRQSRSRVIMDSDDSEGWCNPLSWGKTKEYHFDVKSNGSSCEHTALKLIRDVDDPVLEIYNGQAWTVQHTKGSGKLTWSLVQMNCSDAEPRLLAPQRITLHHVYEVKFRDGVTDSGLLDTIDIKWGDDEELQIKGGVFYDEKILLRGFKKIADDEDDSISNAHKEGRVGARTDYIVVDAGKLGNRVGAGVGTVAVGGLYLAMYVLGTGLFGITGASISADILVVGSVGGFVAGGVIGLGIGAVASLASATGFYSVVRDQRLSATQKIWSKLWCLGGFQTCYRSEVIDLQPTTLIMPKNGKCGSVPDLDSCNRVHGATHQHRMPFPNCMCPEDHEVYCQGRRADGREFDYNSLKPEEGPCECRPAGCLSISGASLPKRITSLSNCKCTEYDHRVHCRGERKVDDRKFDFAKVSSFDSCACSSSELTCNQIMGASGEKSSNCKCKSDDHQVKCLGLFLADRTFNAKYVFDACDSTPYCGQRKFKDATCDAITGASSSREHPNCKCNSDDHKVKCMGVVFANHKFKVADGLSACPSIPYCGFMNSKEELITQRAIEVVKEAQKAENQRVEQLVREHVGIFTYQDVANKSELVVQVLNRTQLFAGTRNVCVSQEKPAAYVFATSEQAALSCSVGQILEGHPCRTDESGNEIVYLCEDWWSFPARLRSSILILESFHHLGMRDGPRGQGMDAFTSIGVNEDNAYAWERLIDRLAYPGSGPEVITYSRP